MKKLKAFILIIVALNLLGCSTKYKTSQEQPLPVNLVEMCRSDVPILSGTNGVAFSAALNWYQTEYTKCAANHNGLIKSLKERGIE